MNGHIYKHLLYRNEKVVITNAAVTVHKVALEFSSRRFFKYTYERMPIVLARPTAQTVSQILKYDAINLSQLQKGYRVVLNLIT